MASDLIVSHLQRLLGIRVDRPVHFQYMAAIGAAAKAIEQGNDFVFNAKQLEATAEQNRKDRLFAPPLSDSLALVGRSDQPASQGAAALAVGLQSLQLIGFNLLLDPDFELVRRNFPTGWLQQPD